MLLLCLHESDSHNVVCLDTHTSGEPVVKTLKGLHLISDGGYHKWQVLQCAYQHPSTVWEVSLSYVLLERVLCDMASAHYDMNSTNYASAHVPTRLHVYSISKTKEHKCSGLNNSTEVFVSASLCL